MPTPSQLPLTQEQEAELTRARDHAPQPYLRERAAVLLKIAAGPSIRGAARTGGLKPHHRDRVCPSSGPLPDRRTGRIAGPQGARAQARLLSPWRVEQAQAQVQETLHRSPRLMDLPRTRWWLDGVRQAIPWLRDCCLATVWHTLDRWDLHYKRGRRHVHSPDWEYDTKVQRIQTVHWYSRQAPQQIVRRYEDELTYYRRPTVAQAYAPAGSDAPHAEQGLGYNTARRIAACLDVDTGRLMAWQRAHFDRETLLHFYQAVEQSYPQAEQIFLIQDNWPVHWHADLVAGLRGSKITLVGLPTYAPWLNPVEKVWRKLYQEVLHLHPWVNAWGQLQATVQAWLEHWADGSLALLRSVGLCPT